MNEFITRFVLGEPGRTIAIKDSIDIAGFPTTAASHAFANAPPAGKHAEIVARLLSAGWQIVGKANMHELAYGMTGINDYTGTPTNPQAAERVPGGSSSGSAALVGAGLADAALGTDTGGSIRAPAACCGVIGLKPTFGRVSRAGVWPTQSTLDCVGPLADRMSVLVEVMSAIAPDFDIAGSHSGNETGKHRPYRIGRLKGLAEPAIEAAITEAVSRAGIQCVDVELPMMRDAFDAGLTIIDHEMFTSCRHLLGRGVLGTNIETRLVRGGEITGEALERAESVRERFTSQVDMLLAPDDGLDVLVLPTMPTFPPTISAVRAGAPAIGITSLIRPFNLSGHPALSLPIPVDDWPLRAGLQIVGRRYDDETVCAVAMLLERAADSCHARLS
ncbi:amidase [Paraburkholderia susongensis]|uniref:Amidase n=1 Tax=Paraburkholderia susongensis TaxID=1515439 RepID=A0A1X7LQR8_9BURK|nr:amidase [Paraburkholderia susongensis]SMG56231.1 amidase [Paraburkholderia susongensis]